jgi:glycogen debranching enzyme
VRITINEDTTFLIADELGNVPEGAELGLYQDDTRFVSHYELCLNGEPPLGLAARATDYYAATHVLTNPPLHGMERNVLSIVRQRLVGRGMHEDLDIVNHGDREAAFTLELRIDADFAHIFDVKREISVEKEAIRRVGDFSLDRARDGNSLRFRYQRGDLRRCLIVGFSEPPVAERGCCRWALRLAPRETWHLCVNFQTLEDQCEDQCPVTCDRGRTPGAVEPGPIGHGARRHADSVLRAPRLETDFPALRRAYAQSAEDYAALQIKGKDVSDGELALAAGIPWFMALFGRDSLIAAYQALPQYPLLARGVLRALARLQGTRVDRVSAEEPGKILHEHRSGTLASRAEVIPKFPYYGTIDATPLFLMLLGAVHRVTHDLDFARSLRENAVRALDWMERFGDRDGDGYLEYARDAEVGLENQGWKDSHDSVRFRDGSLAPPPIALCEVQGYAYAARLGIADVFDALGEPERAGRLRAEAAGLKERFNRDFWLPERGFYAEALDGQKRPVDALTSNAGQLLWTGIADDDKARLVADRLLGPELFTGWGIRTMGSSEGGYNPISYHNGSVWPHDTSLIVSGLARYGFVEHAMQLTDGLLAALDQYPDHRLPELFGGYDQRVVPFVVEYPTASRPQAWASGSVFLLVNVMLGVDAQLLSLPNRARPFLPSGAERLRIGGIWTAGRRTAVEVRGMGTRVNSRVEAEPGAA